MACLINVSGVTFFPSRAKEARKQKKKKMIMPDLRLLIGY